MLADWKLPPLFRSRASQQRDKFLQDSLASSFVLSESLANWSSTHDPQSHLCVMRFDEEWQNPQCEVMKWYKLQSCKQFKSIQHWRNLDTQFDHEFLIVTLTDGSACRVERMGEGSRADAIRWIGCTAFDLIQWFAPKDHAAKRWSRGSDELIIEVEFPTPFDLLDILAVCYTIQHKSPRAAVYTLQRFNCYFLCNTILTVLTRRVAAWETMITNEDWPALVDDMIDDLKRKLLLPVEQQHPTDFLALGLCSLLDPGSDNPAGFLLEPMRSSMKYSARGRVNRKLANALWCKDIDPTITVGLAPYYEQACDTVLNNTGSDPTMSKLQALLEGVNTEQFPPNGLDLGSIQNSIFKEILALCCSCIKYDVALAKWELRMQEFENQPSYLRRLAGEIAGLLAVSVPSSLVASRVTLGSDEDLDVLCRRFGVTVRQLAAAIPTATKMDIAKLYVRHSGAECRAPVDNHTIDLASTLVDTGAERLFRVMLTILHPDPGSVRVPATLALLNTYFPKVCWKWCFGVCMLRLRMHNYHSLFGQRADTLLIHSSKMDSTLVLASELTVADFQKHMQGRIRHHAERVQSFKLAAAPLVQQDVELSMTQVWESLPSGFGARKV